MQRILFALTGVLLISACESKSPLVPMEDAADDDLLFQTTLAQAMGMTAEDLAALPAFTPREAPEGIFLAPGESTVLDFEDLELGGGHVMVDHSPYHDVNFSGVPGVHAISHFDNAAYGRPHSGTQFVVNGFGRDGESMEFLAAGGVKFEGAWVANPHGFSPDFWFDGYNGATFVGSSAVVSLARDMQWVEAGFSGPVTRVEMRRTEGPGVCSTPRAGYRCWWVMDDVTFGPANPETKDDCKDGAWEQYGFKSQGQCVRFVETGKDSR